MRHWDAHDPPTLPSVRWSGSWTPGRSTRTNRRTLGPPLSFGYAVCATPGAPRKRLRRRAPASFPVLLRSAARRWLDAGGGYRDRRRLARGVDAQVLAPLCGADHGNDRLARAARLHPRPQRAYCMSHMHADRLRGRGLPRCPVSSRASTRAGEAVAPRATRSTPHSSSMQAGTCAKASGRAGRGFAQRERSGPDLRLELYGDGPERGRGPRGRTRPRARRSWSTGAGRRTRSRPHSHAPRASRRPPSGRVTASSSSRPPRRGTPSVVVDGPENAATELVTEGVNGAIAPERGARRSRGRNPARDRRQARSCARRPPPGSTENRSDSHVDSSLELVARTTRYRAPTPFRVRRLVSGGPT